MKNSLDATLHFGVTMTDSRHVLVATSGHNAHVLSLIDLEKNTGRRSMGSTNSKQDKGTEEKPDRSR